MAVVGAETRIYIIPSTCTYIYIYMHICRRGGRADEIDVQRRRRIVERASVLKKHVWYVYVCVCV